MYILNSTSLVVNMDDNNIARPGHATYIVTIVTFVIITGTLAFILLRLPLFYFAVPAAAWIYSIMAGNNMGYPKVDFR